MNVNLFDLSKAEIVKPIIHKNNGTLRDVGSSVLRHPKTKVYLIYEFNFDNQDMVVIIVEYWVGIRGEYSREMLVVDRNCIKKIPNKL